MIKSTWRNLLPADEIGRQQAIKERLRTGCHAELRFGETLLGGFLYSGIWDTMHVFYPEPDNAIDLVSTLDGNARRYLRRDLRGRLFVQLPYTILADSIISISYPPTEGGGQD